MNERGKQRDPAARPSVRTVGAAGREDGTLLCDFDLRSCSYRVACKCS
jgi:hypothetical protein